MAWHSSRDGRVSAAARVDERAAVVVVDDGTLFLTELGESMVPEYVTHRMRRYVEGADLGKKGSCHIFRHTMATAMLDAGADVRFVQEMLGHASLATTQIYTHLSIGKLKEIHSLTHPSAKMNGAKKSTAAVVADPVIVTMEAEKEALLGMLDAEDDEPDDGV
jgi:integrase/recombinase XerD